MVTNKPSGMFALVIIASLSPSALAGQEPCSRCNLGITQVAVLEAKDIPIVPSLSPSVARFSNGDYVVSQLFQEPALTLYNGRGEIKQLYTRRGKGPGELAQSPRLFIGPGDTLYALEPGRLLRFTRDLQHLKTSQLDMNVREHAVVRDNGDIVVDARVRGGPNVSFLQSIIGRDGKLHTSLNKVSSVEPPATVLGPGIGGTWWSIQSNSSVLQQWADGTDAKRTVAVARPWFTGWDNSLRGAPYTEKPMDQVQSISQLDARRVLVISTLADSKWKAAAERGTLPQVKIAQTDYSRFYDTVIEVVDVSNGLVVGTGRFDRLLLSVEGAADLLWSSEQDSDGFVSIRIWRVVLE